MSLISMGTSRFVFDSSLGSSSHGNMFLLGSMGGITFTGGGAAPAVLSTAEIVGVGIGAKRRPFFTSPEELMFEEDYYNDEQLLPEKKRRLTPEQVHMLEMSFEAENKLEPDRKTELAKKLGLQPRQVAVWFQNRRVRWKNKQIQREFDRLKSLYDALLVNHDSVLADNQRLRSEVISLKKKLEAKNDLQQPQEEHKSHAETPEEEEDLLPVAQAGGPAPPIVQHDVEEEKGGDHLSNLSLLEVDSTLNAPYTEEVVDEGSFYGGCRYVVHSEEDDGSDDNAGGCYFTRVLSANYKVVVEEDEEKSHHGLSWWVWS